MCYRYKSSQYLSLSLYLYFIDVCSSFFPSVYEIDSITSINSTVTSISLDNWTCNSMAYDIFDFSVFTCLEELNIGNNSFAYVKLFKIGKLKRLRSLKIGVNSFTQRKNDCGNDRSKSFHIVNCESLESIEIGKYSFSDFGGEFELKNLKRLNFLKIGSIGEVSYNFNYSSFVIQSAD